MKNNRLSIMYLIALTMAGLTWAPGAKAQDELPKWGSYFNVQTGWAFGGSSSGFLGEVVGGATYRRWGLGLGIGLDNDLVTSLPLVADLRFALIPKEHHSLELFSQQGFNYVTQKPEAWSIIKYDKGPFWYGGLTYKVYGTSRTTGLWVSLGASYKQYAYEKEIEYDIPGPERFGPAYSDPAHVIHKEWRGVVTVGWGW